MSLNCNDRIDPAKILKRLRYEHPIYTHETVQAQKRRTEINGVAPQSPNAQNALGRSFYCGAYWGFGFHEDGLRSAVEVAEMLDSGWA